MYGSAASDTAKRMTGVGMASKGVAPKTAASGKSGVPATAAMTTTTLCSNLQRSCKQDANRYHR